MLGPDDLDRLPRLEHRAHAIGSHTAFGVVEPGGEGDVVQEQPDRRGVVDAGEHACLSVGHRDAQRDVRGLLAQPVNDRPGATDQPRRGVQIGVIKGLGGLRVHSRSTRAQPGCGHHVGDGALQR